MPAPDALRAMTRRVSRRIPSYAAVLAGAVLVAGCAQLSSWMGGERYKPGPANSETDAQYQAQGAGYHTVFNTPSQVQIDLHSSNERTEKQQRAAPDDPPAPPTPAGGANARMTAAGAAEAPAAPAEGTNPVLRAFMPQAQTYAGTFPCLTPSAQCEAQRVIVTLGPNGRWRSRTTYLATKAAPLAPQAEQGCWTVTTDRPARVLLLDEKGATRTELLATANNVLRVKSVLGRTPTLGYNLTRQPDLDSIDELAKKPPPVCE
jgi:hypothetical protein